jgi:hypothetical protein
MAIGDLIREFEPDEELALIHAQATARLSGTSAADLFTRCRFKVSDGQSFSGIAALLENFHTCFSYGTDFGVESVAVPFGHAFVVSSQSSNRSERLENEICRKIDERWKAAIDPATGARIAILNAPAAERDSIAVYFGTGAFVPDRGERPVGTVEIDPLGDRSLEIPVIGDTGTPAGLYRAQEALTFGSARDLAPAFVDWPTTEAFLFFLGRGPSSLPPYRPLQVLNLEKNGSHSGYKIRRNEPRHEPDGDDVEDEFVVSFNRNNEFLIRYRADVRASRLRRRARPGRFAITGIVEPHHGQWLVSDHWWLDLDAQSTMTGSSLVPKARSIAVRQGVVHCYDWRTFSEDRKIARTYRLERAAVRDRGGLRILRRQDWEPFGFLERPAEQKRVVFVSGDETTDPYSLDWIDSAAGAETAFRREGLASLWGIGDSADIVVGPAGADWSFRAVGDVLYRASPDAEFEALAEIPWRPGGQIALGPLILTMLEGIGGR